MSELTTRENGVAFLINSRALSLPSSLWATLPVKGNTISLDWDVGIDATPL